MSLAAYYYLVVVRGYQESKLKEMFPYLVAVPSLFGIGLAIAGLPIYVFSLNIIDKTALPGLKEIISIIKRRGQENMPA